MATKIESIAGVLTPYFIEQTLKVAIRTRWKHPGNLPNGIEYKFCLLCQGEWQAGEKSHHKFPNNLYCPIEMVEFAQEANLMRLRGPDEGELTGPDETADEHESKRRWIEQGGSIGKDDK